MRSLIHVKNNMKRYGYIYIMVFVLSSMFFYMVDDVAAKGLQVGEYSVEYDEARPADTNENGTNDRTSYYKAGVLVFTAYDENEDGKDDLWFRYRADGAVDLELADSGTDGRPDMITEVDASEKAEMIYNSGARNRSPIIWIVIAIIVGGVSAWFVAKKYFNERVQKLIQGISRRRE